MKIGFVSAHPFTYPGGVQTHTLALKEEFEDRGHSIKLIFPREEFPQKKDKDTILLGGAFYVSSNASKANISFQVTPLVIKRMLKKENFDILHFQNLGLFLPIQVLDASNSLKEKGKKMLNILTLHAFWDASKIFRDWAFLIDVLNKNILPKFDGVIAVSSPVLSQIKYNGPIEIIPNGINLEIFHPKGKTIKKFSDGKVNILFVGRIEKRKGLIYLLEAFNILRKKHKNIRLIIVGDGERKDKMERLVKKKRIPDVFFEGNVSNVNLPKYYRTADICCFPSVYGEAFGIVLLEAMATAKPVVAFANKGYREVLKADGAEFLSRPKDFNELSKKIEVLVKNKNLRKKMGEWGRREAKKYSWTKVADRTLNFYDKVLKSKTR